MTHAASVGRIVHYYQGDYESPPGYTGRNWPGTNGTRTHPAIITHVHTDDCVNLIVFLDAGMPMPKTSMCRLPDEVFHEGVHCSNAGWRWPTRV